MPRDASDLRNNDRQVLIEILYLIEQQLRIVLFERRDLLHKEFHQLVPGEPWSTVVSSFEKARHEIAQGNLDWEYIEGVGLTGSTLKWKGELIKESARQGVVGRFLEMANSLLGSLASTVPGVEFIKEYKEMIEACLKFRRNLD